MMIKQVIDSALAFTIVLIKFSGSQITSSRPYTAVQNYGSWWLLSSKCSTHFSSALVES